MNSTTSTLEAPPSLERRLPLATHPSSVGLSSARPSPAQRLALRLGLALVIWGRRRPLESRDTAQARRTVHRERHARELATQRRFLLELPPR